MTEHPPEPAYEPPRASGPQRPEPRYLKPRWRRAGRILWIAAFSVLGFVVLAIAAALVWLHTGGGRETLGRYVANEARNAIQGDLRVHDIQVGGFLRVCADGVDLRDPDGHRVLSAERACVRLRPLPLAAHRITIAEADLEKPWIEIAKVPGSSETTLQRAIKPRKPPQPGGGGPFAWKIEVGNLRLRGGSVTVRPELGAEATFALRDLEITDAHARYAADSAAAALKVSAGLQSPGRAPVALQLDATLEGAAPTGTVALRSLRVKLGDSGVAANGSWDLARQAGELHLRELVLLPKDVETIAPKAPLEGALRGEVDLRSDGKTAGAELRLDAGGGRIVAKLTATLEKAAPVWDVQLAVEGVDPGALSDRAPKGEVTARLTLHGTGIPRFDAHGVTGDLRGALHVGPARLDRVGPVVMDLDASVLRRYAIVRAFTATALGLQIKAHGAAAYDEISLDLDVQAPDLSQVGRAVGALLRKPTVPMGGSARLIARVTGAPLAPEAAVSLRAPALQVNRTLVAEGLTVTGDLHGPLKRPDGSLRIAARRFSASAIDLGSPRVDMSLQWPWAHLRTDALVAGGALQLEGDARIDEDKDGLLLSKLLVSWPENTLHLANDVRVHVRDTLIVEPLDLVGEHGSVRLQAQIQPPPGRIDASIVVSRFELDRLPRFALPPQLGLRGVLDANAVVQGPRAQPDLDLRAQLSKGGAQPLGDLALDAQAHAHVHQGTLQAEGFVEGGSILRVDFSGHVPVQIARQPANAPIEFEARLAQVDLARLAETAKIPALQRQEARGTVDVRIVGTGTLAAPHATLAVEAHGLGTRTVQQVDARAGMLLDKDAVAFDGEVLLAGAQAVGLTARAPFDLLRALREPEYVRGALERPLAAELAITQLPLERLVASGLLPPESSGVVSLSARLSGTPLKPTLQIDSRGEDVFVGRLHGLVYQGQMVVADRVHMTVGAQSRGDVVARLEAAASVSGAELAQLLRRRGDRKALDPLLDRAVSIDLQVPGLPIARASQLAGARREVAEGQIVGKVALAGTAARPKLTAQMTIRDLSAQQKALGATDLYVEANERGALFHLGVDPPGGGNLLGHVKVDADLGARALLSGGARPVLEGRLSGDLQAKQLDLSFLAGLVPNLRRAGGRLDGNLAMAGTVRRPVAQGDAHLRTGLFDVVGQGVYEDVGFDANFSPKEVVIDRVTGTVGAGTFSAIVAASRRPLPDGSQPDRIEFTGELHLGDAESVRDRKVPGTEKPLQAGPIPMRQAGEQRADVSGELDIFGDYTGNVLTLNGRIPDARVVIKQLPDKKLPSLKENPDVFLLHPGQRPHPPGREPEDVEKEEQARKSATFVMHAHLDLDHLYVKAPDFEFPVQSRMNFVYDARHPDAFTADGTVHVPQGSFSALGRRFTIEDARIIETGGPIGDPELEIKAVYDNPQAKVTITVTGSARQPALEMSSVPPMDQDQIAFFLATGRIQGRATQQGGGVDLRGAATSVVGGLLFGQVRKELANVLPVDVITIDTNSQGVAGASVGKYIGDRVFIGYRQRFTEAPYENTVEGHLEYEISRSVSAEMTYGDRTKDFTILYTKDF